MSDDTTPHMLVDPLEARVSSFRQQPEAKGFAALRAELREAGRGELLAELCATWAQHEKDPIRAADAWSEAGEAMVVLGETATAVEYLRTALELDPTNDRATDRLLEIVEPDDPAAAVEIIEHELAELAKNTKRKPEISVRRAQQHRRAAGLWNDHLGRVDRALQHWQQAFKLEPARTESLEQARILYRSLGDENMVAKLYQAELDVLGNKAENAPKKAKIRFELGKLALKQKQLETAAQHLEEAAKLDPGSPEIAESLAEVYASPGFREDQTRAKAGQLFVELGKRNRHDQSGIQYLRRAVGVDPYSRATSHALEQALDEASQWDELDRQLRHRTQIITDDGERVELLKRRAALYRTQLPNRSALIEVLSELVAYEQPGSKTSRELRELLVDDQQWEKVTALMEAEINALGQNPETPADTIVGELLELATIAREHMGDRDRAAELLHQALAVDPMHEEALARYVDHFRERRDWRGLIELYEFALDNARNAGADADDLVRRLEEIGQLAELRLGDIPRAIDAWQRIAEIEPGSAKVTEALRRLSARGKMWEQLVTQLEHEVATATNPVSRAQSLKKMAQTYRERQIEPRRAIELYEQILTEDPGQDDVLKALSELYEREGDDAGLANTLRRVLELEEQRVVDAMARVGKNTDGAKDWPVAKRAERLTMLRRIAQLYETRLADVDGVVFACGAVLELIPGDRDALERMERVLEKAGDPRLEQTLEYHAAAATSPAERAKLMKRLAKLATAREDDLAALERWEHTLRASPSDPDALAALSELYDRSQRWAELAQILERLDGGRPLPATGTPEAAIRGSELQRYAQLLDEHLRDAPKATKAWHRVLELSPKNRFALEALARLYRENGKWQELAQTLAAMLPLVAAHDQEAASAIAMERADILEQRLGAPNEAIKALDLLIHEVDPNHLAAHTALRRLHEARGDFDAAVRVAEREMYLSPDTDRKIGRGLEIGAICRDQLNNPTRALQAFKRVLELDGQNEEALAASADLLAKLGRWKDHVLYLERMLGLRADEDAGEERRALVQRIAAATADRLGDPKSAFRWWRRAHDEAPDEQTLADVRRAAESYGLWRELAEVLTDERRRIQGDTRRFIDLSRELAGLAERRLNDKTKAMQVYAEALAASPRDASLLAELDRLAQEVDQRNAWKNLLDAYEVALAAAGPAEKVELHLRRARVLEDKVNDAKGAVQDALQAFSWAPDRDDIREALVALAGKARAWPEVIAVDSALVDRAQTPQRRVEILRRKAVLIEEQLKDAPRAFRTHLVALLVAPDDNDTTSHLWRLARVIGKYREVDRTPSAEPAAAMVQDAQAFVIAPKIPKRAATEPLFDADLSIGDSTQPIDLSELEPATRSSGPISQEFVQDNKTMALSEKELRGMVVPPRLPPGAKAPPLPPPRPPAIRKSASPPPAPRKPQAPVRRAPLPQLPNRPFESPWEELATAYEGLPAPDVGVRLRWLYRASEVWETGGKDITRAFDALARAFALARKAPDGDSEVRARLQRIAGEHKAWDRLAELYEGMAEEAESAPQAADLLLEVATIREGQKRPRDAEAQLRRILGMLPNESVARGRLETLYRNEGRWVELAASLEERTDPRLGTAAPEAERPQLLRELAAIYTDKLTRPHDAIDAFERLRLLAPADTAVLARLADLYAAVGRWSKVIETLGRINEVAEGTPEARDALRRIAKIYETEMELPERAIDAYDQIVESWPDDGESWQALDGLYTANARWEALAEVLRKRAALARDPAEKAQLLARRAHVLLEWLDSAEEAAAALRHARTVAPDDVAIADQLVNALVKANKDREAAAILEDRIDTATAPGGAKTSAGDVAALYIRLGQLRSEKLDDPSGARESIDAALALVPEHPTALAVLAQLAHSTDDPRAFADAKLREAEHAADDDARIAALMAAGDAQSRIGETAQARTSYERVLGLRSYHAEATWALAGLVEKGGDPDSAARLLEARLEAADSLTPPERARLLTQLAALSRVAGVDIAAERRLLEALGAMPDHIPAVVALADFYADAGRWTDVEAFLRETLDATTLAAAPAALVADLHRRLATAHEKLGRDEEAYQTLVAADRLHRGHLLIKLALGENRYKARRWREATLHLSPLAAHDDAARYPTEVAQGLYHAALAEIRSLRPEKAPPLYARALELKPNYAPALQALAEVAMEQGDHKKAADLLTRQATATEEYAERLKLFEALGDMSLLLLHDEERAATCFAAAVAAAQPLEAKHVPLLEKLLERQTAANDRAGAGRTAELMAAFGASPAERAQKYLRAARDFLAAGDHVRARGAADRAVEADPYAVDAVDTASQLAIELGDVDAAATMLTRLLGNKSGTGDDVPRRAMLSYRLGHARASRGDTKLAFPAYEQAIALAPDSEGATLARRGLVELQKGGDVVDHLQAIAAASGKLEDLVAWAHELRRVERIDAARHALDVAIGLGHVADVHEVAFLTQHKPFVLRDDESYRAALEPADHNLIDPEALALGPIATALADAAPLLWPDLEQALARSGVAGAKRIPATLHVPATAMFPRLTTALGTGAVNLYSVDEGPDVTVVASGTPTIVLGPRMLNEATPHAEVRALLARAVTLLRPEHLAFAGLPAGDAAKLAVSIARLFGPQPLRDAVAPMVADADVQRGHDELVKGALSVKIRARLEELLRGATALDVVGYVAASLRAADRAALLLDGDPAIVARLAAGHAHLIRAAAGPGWLPLRQRLGLGVR